MGDHWRVSALVTKLKTEEEDLLVDILHNWKPKKFKIPKSNLPKLKKDKEKGLRYIITTRYTLW